MKAGDKHRHPVAVLAIVIAEHGGQVALFQLQRDQDVAGCGQREE